MRKYILAALLAGGFAAPALAQDAQPFSGPRIEGLIGYETTDVEDETDDGLAFGIGVGFDSQSGSTVFGIEAEAGESQIDKCVKGVTVPNDTYCVQSGRDFYVGGRFGAVVGSNALLYAKAGYTNARIRTEYATVLGTEVRGSENLDGVRAGGGVELGLGSTLYAKAEYRYSNYEQGFDKHQGIVGLGLRF